MTVCWDTKENCTWCIEHTKVYCRMDLSSFSDLWHKKKYFHFECWKYGILAYCVSLRGVNIKPVTSSQCLFVQTSAFELCTDSVLELPVAIAVVYRQCVGTVCWYCIFLKDTECNFTFHISFIYCGTVGWCSALQGSRLRVSFHRLIPSCHTMDLG